jgi:hypothetical protein
VAKKARHPFHFANVKGLSPTEGTSNGELDLANPAATIGEGHEVRERTPTKFEDEDKKESFESQNLQFATNSGSSSSATSQMMNDGEDKTPPGDYATSFPVNQPI